MNRLLSVVLSLVAARQALASSFRDESSTSGFFPWVARRLATTTVKVPVNNSFVWDGSSSDLAQQYYRLYKSGESASSLGYTTSKLPATIQQRLAAAKLKFEDLPGLLQRALVWDSGYTLDSDNNFIRVYTVGGVSMAEIAVSTADYLSANCTTQSCEEPNGNEIYRSDICSGSMMLSVSHCASEEVATQDGDHASMWATGGDPNAVPALTMIRHSWFDNVFLENYLVFAIHTISVEEPAWDHCMSSGVYSSMIIPCSPYSADTAAENGWSTPAYGKLTTAWLAQYKQESSNAFRMIWLIPILAGAAVMSAGAYGYMRWQRRQSISKDAFSLSSSPRSPGNDRGPETHIKRTYRAANSDQGYQQAGSGWIYGSNISSSASIMRILMADPKLRERRVPMDKLIFEREVAKGAFGEVWVCSLEGKVVGVKRLLRTRKHTFDDIQTFMDEIQLTASLDHPNVLNFIGVAWNVLENLCMVMEYLPNGDMQTFLRSHRDVSPALTWADDKHRLALGIAKALTYLHSRQPKLIHRDVKAKNVLLTLNFEAKLIDFGVSRTYGENCMTVGVGTPFWTAPEVLDGSVYSEKSDIYSFGVVLAELDTCAAPYEDARGAGKPKPVRQSSTATTASRTSTATALQPFHILKLVMAGCLRPNFSATCPSAVLKIADMCLQRDPDARPSAQQVVSMLESLSSEKLREEIGAVSSDDADVDATISEDESSSEELHPNA